MFIFQFQNQLPTTFIINQTTYGGAVKNLFGEKGITDFQNNSNNLLNQIGDMKPRVYLRKGKRQEMLLDPSKISSDDYSEATMKYVDIKDSKFGKTISNDEAIFLAIFSHLWSKNFLSEADVKEKGVCLGNCMAISELWLKEVPMAKISEFALSSPEKKQAMYDEIFGEGAYKQLLEVAFTMAIKNNQSIQVTNEARITGAPTPLEIRRLVDKMIVDYLQSQGEFVNYWNSKIKKEKPN